MHSPPFSDFICSLPTASRSLASINSKIQKFFRSKENGRAKVRKLLGVVQESILTGQRKQTTKGKYSFAASLADKIKYIENPAFTPSPADGVEKQRLLLLSAFCCVRVRYVSIIPREQNRILDRVCLGHVRAKFYKPHHLFRRISLY